MMDVFALAMGYASSSAEGAAGCDLLTDDGPIPDEIDDAVRTAIVDIADRMECLDMRAVVIVEFWARYMLDELPWGWHWVCVGGGHVAAPPGGGMCADSASEAWAWDIAARPRLEP